ncbi:MAG: (5-formylfuran-3-yl)methyl phosphate synthase [Piscinibacter sp.]|nr:(5-formylfuran-3-yl)methyl phosphate synthase [Piscinibacter sp.]
MIRLLVSVRSVEEALVAARGGADFIDLKEPGQGALGGLPVATIRAIVAALRARGIEVPVSATIGDLPMSERLEIARRVAAVAACGVTYVKVGITREPEARPVLDDLAALGPAIVPVFVADGGLDDALVDHAIALGFPGLMADTADKHAGCLFDRVSVLALSRFVTRVRGSGAMVGLAGALRNKHLPRLAGLAPDFAGFRSAVCIGERDAALDARCLADLRDALRAAQAPIAPRSAPSSSERIRASSPL